MSVFTVFRRRRLWIGALVASIAGAGAIAGCNRGHGGWRHHGHALHESHSVEDARDHLQSKMKWVLRALDANEMQEAKIQAIGDETIAQLYPLLETHHTQHQAMVEALTADEVDRAELERLRRAHIQLADAASNHVVDALADISAALNDEQRAQLREHIAEHHR